MAELRQLLDTWNRSSQQALGSLDTDEVAKALLLHCNTPPPDLGASPAEILFSHPLNGHLLNSIKFRCEWLELADMCEKAINQQFVNNPKHTKSISY